VDCCAGVGQRLDPTTQNTRTGHSSLSAFLLTVVAFEERARATKAVFQQQG